MVARSDHPLAGRRLAVSELAGESFLVREPASGTRRHLDALLAAHALIPGSRMEISSNETIKQAVIAGLGISLLSAHTVAAEVADERLVVLDVEGLPIMRRWLVVRMARRAFTPAARALWQFFLDEGAAWLPALDDGAAGRRSGPVDPRLPA